VVERLPVQPISQLPFLQVRIALVALFSFVCLSGCGGCNFVASLPSEVVIPVKDPVIAKLVSIADRLEIKASGQLHAGDYVIRNTPVSIPQGTAFDLSFSVPLSGRPSINIKDATGSFTCTKELKLFGAPAPTHLEFSQGKISGDLQFIRSLCGLLVELVNQQINPSQRTTHDIAGIVQEIKIEKLDLPLKDSCRLDLPGMQLVLGSGSILKLIGLTADQQFNYQGQCQANLNLKPGSVLVDEKDGVVVDLGTGRLAVNLGIASAGGLLQVESQAGQQSDNDISIQPVTLTIRHGQNGCLVKCAAANLRSFSWSAAKRLGSNDCTVNASGQLVLNGIAVSVKRPDSQLVFKIPQQASLAFMFQNNEQGRKFQLDTPAVIEATGIQLAAVQSDGAVSIAIDRAALGCSISSAPELTGVTLPKGDLEPRRIVWMNGDKKVEVSMPKGCKLSLTRNVKLALNPTSEGIEGKFPLSIHGGTTTIEGDNKEWTLNGINGDVVLDLKGKSTSITGKLNTVLEEKSQAFGGVTTFGIRLGSIKISSVEGHPEVQLGGCKIVIPRKVLAQIICAKLPQKRSFSVNKEVMQDSRWRYRNLIAREAHISDLKVQQFKFSGPNVLAFNGEADVFVRGTVERSSAGLLSLLERADTSGSWRQCPWSAAAHVRGAGNVQFVFNPGSSLADSSVDYAAIVQMAVPDDLNLDWSQVAPPGDNLARVETGLVRGALKMGNFCLPPDELSLKREGRFNLFSKPSEQLREVKLTNCSAKAVGDNLTIEFSSRVAL
jgi:hypothetical protein